jgi:hypothetical protein
MWSFCDDRGVHPASVMRLKMEVFPADDFSKNQMQNMIDELMQVGLVSEFEEFGRSYFCVTGWHHQKIDRPTYRYPAPPGENCRPKEFDESSTTTRRALDEPSPPEGKGKVRVQDKDRTSVNLGSSNTQEASFSCHQEEKKKEPSGDSQKEIEAATKTRRAVEKVYERMRKVMLEKKLPAPRKLTKEREDKLATRLETKGWLDSLKAAFDKCPLPGDGWQPDFDWLVANDTHVENIAEGKYDWRENNGKPKNQRRLETEDEILEELRLGRQGAEK